MTVKGPRKGEPSLPSMRNGLRTQPAQLVRGSSRRIMTMRFRPANIRVINRRVCSLAVIGTAVRTEALRAHQQERVPPAPPIEVRGRCQNGARRQGFASPRRARPCLLCAVLAGGPCDGRLRREHSPAASAIKKGPLPPCRESRPGFPTIKPSAPSKGIDRSLHIRNTPSSRAESSAETRRS
jgi:hypothetical protein